MLGFIRTAMYQKMGALEKVLQIKIYKIYLSNVLCTS